MACFLVYRNHISNYVITTVVKQYLLHLIFQIMIFISSSFFLPSLMTLPQCGTNTYNPHAGGIDACRGKKKKREVWHHGTSDRIQPRRPRIVLFILWYTWGWPYLLFNPPPLSGLHQDTPDRAGHNPATEDLDEADLWDRGLLA